MSVNPWHKHYHADALNGMAGLPVDLRGVYYTLLDMMYDARCPLACSDQMFAARMSCSVRKWKAYRDSLIAMGKIHFTSEGKITNKRFEKELNKPARSSLSAATRLAVLERDQWTCSYCDTQEGPFHVDHIYPVSKGGSDDLDNLCCSCAPCNLTKSDKTLEELGWSCG